MQPSPVQCPECGAPAPFRGAAISLVCEYCGSTVVRTGVDLKLIGKVSALLDNGSPILLDSRGKLLPDPPGPNVAALPFEVVGRLQLRHGRGTWNEWFLNFSDGTVGWLADAQGSYSVLRPRDKSIVAGKVPTFRGLDLGQTIVLQGVPHVLVERRAATYQGAEGILPFAADPGVKFYSADLRGHDGEFATLDYGEDGNHQSPTLYTGRAVDLISLGLQPLRRFAGWRT
jgi:ribosomal protein S27E